jgi:hypothetical protein
MLMKLSLNDFPGDNVDITMTSIAAKPTSIYQMNLRSWQQQEQKIHNVKLR